MERYFGHMCGGERFLPPSLVVFDDHILVAFQVFSPGIKFIGVLKLRWKSENVAVVVSLVKRSVRCRLQ